MKTQYKDKILCRCEEREDESSGSDAAPLLPLERLQPPATRPIEMQMDHNLSVGQHRMLFGMTKKSEIRIDVKTGNRVLGALNRTGDVEFELYNDDC
jgi:hypothetical protein